MQRFSAGVHAPLRVALIAPARLVGEARDETATGWHGHALEIRDAVIKMLKELARKARELQDMTQGSDAQLGDQIASLTSPEVLDIRVISAGGFSRELLAEKDVDLKVTPPEELKLRPAPKREGHSDPVGDLLHIACSEVVVIDESHNFRNQSSYGTRALRFVLSLPCPGEPWPLIWNEASPAAAPEQQTLVTRRRVLCLSATPFNNRLEDIVTQIGHFSQHQDWHIALNNTRGQGSLFASTPLEEHLSAWRDAKPGDDPAQQDLRGHFEGLVRHVYRHLRSGRSLSRDADVMLEKERDEAEVRDRISDRGPEYLWPDTYNTLKRQLSAAHAWLKQRRNNPEASDTTPEAQEARARLDAMLCDLMVQRSRARALKLTAVTEGANIERMFRKPPHALLSPVPGA